tara:strand:+ start:128 stop:490 length:363 start_codon:yes stop_codon:yes gene_type:complete
MKKVGRLSKSALQKILQGKVKEPATCVVKFYSNRCHYCHELHKPYSELAENYDDVYFFAFNIDDYPEVEKIIGFNGIPTLCLIKTGTHKPKHRVIPDPKTPNKKMWYHIRDIKKFIEKER